MLSSKNTAAAGGKAAAGKAKAESPAKAEGKDAQKAPGKATTPARKEREPDYEAMAERPKEKLDEEAAKKVTHALRQASYLKQYEADANKFTENAS